MRYYILEIEGTNARFDFFYLNDAICLMLALLEINAPVRITTDEIEAMERATKKVEETIENGEI